METGKVKIVRSDRRTLALSIDRNGQICVKAPLHYPEAEIRKFVESKRQWLEKHLARRQGSGEAVLTEEELRALAKRASAYIPGRVRYYASLLGVTYGRITIRNQTTRWGSCSSEGNLNFNCLLMLMPPEMVDYTVVHELCHRLEMNHSKRFWDLVGSILPDYRARVRWMRENGGRIMARNPK